MKYVISESVACTLQVDSRELNRARKIEVKLRKRGAVIEGTAEALLELASELDNFDDFDNPAGLRAAKKCAARIREAVARCQKASPSRVEGS